MLPIVPSTPVIALFTIREDEFLAAIDSIGPGKVFTGSSGQPYVVCEVAGAHGHVSVAVFRAVHQANAEAQTLVQRAIDDLAPSWVLVVGIAGGIAREDFTVGDVLIGTEIVDFTYEVKRDGPSDLNKRTLPLHRDAHAVVAMLPATLREAPLWSSEGFVGAQHPSPPTLAQRLPEVQEPYASKVTACIEHHLRNPRAEPKALSASIGSSNGLQKSGDFLKLVTDGNRLMACVEMESVGAYAACNTGTPIPMLTIRGISDIVGIARSDGWTEYACKSAAAVAARLIRSGVLNPRASASDAGPPPYDAITTSVTFSEGHPTDTATLELALRNILKFGDTDIFPRPFELGAFRDCMTESLALLQRVGREFDEFFPQHPPANLSALTHVSHTAFRWAAQMDPLYNAYLLSLCLSLGPTLETTRVRPALDTVFSYRFKPDVESGRLFDDEVSWEAFNQVSHREGARFDWIVKTDIADFYPRVSHERLGSILESLAQGGVTAQRVMAIIREYTKRSGVGLPVGGPAARMLAEAYLGPSDHLLRAKGVRFCRYVDDYVLFAKSEREASRLLADLAQVLGDFEGLSLQKLKTRIMRKGEFLRSYSHELDGDLDQASLSFLRLRLRYDPYSATAAEDYEAIRQSVSGYDVLGMLARETRKSRVHQQLTKKLLLAVRFIADGDVDDAVVTVGENLRILLPLFGSVAALLNALVPRSKTSARELLARRLEALLTDPDGPAPLEITRMMTVRLLASLGGADAENLLWREYEESDSVLVRKECIWGLCRLKSVSLLRPLLTRFDRSSSWERRALIAGSYVLAEEGATFRRINSPRFSPFEHLILTWCEKRGGSIFAATPDDI